MSRTPCALIYEDRYYEGLDDLFVRLARELGAWSADTGWDHISARGAGSLREDALRLGQDAEVVIAVGDGDRPRLLLGTDYTPAHERQAGESAADYAVRLGAQWTASLRARWTPDEAAQCHGVALLWNQESVLLAAHEAWCLDPRTCGVVEGCEPCPQTLDDAQFAEVFEPARLPQCGASLARAIIRCGSRSARPTPGPNCRRGRECVRCPPRPTAGLRVFPGSRV